MADELQALFDRINQDAIQRGESECAKLIAGGREEAARLVSEAKEEAARLLASARAEAETMKRKSEEALRQSGREIMLEVRAELERRVAGAVSSLLKEQLKGEELGAIIANLCAAYLAKSGSEESISVLISPAELESVTASVKARLAADLQQNVSLAPSRALAGGFQLSISGSDVRYDFSDEALTEALAAHLAPALGAVITRK
jgi:vacuolar-type H+-ATPase subunit H